MHRRRLSARFFVAPLLIVLGTGAGTFAKPASDEALDTLGVEVQRCVAEHDGPGFVKQYDIESFLDRVLHNFPASPAIANDVRTGIREAFATKLGPALTALPEGTVLTFIHPREVAGEQHLVFRLRGPQGLNYWDCSVSTDAAGVPRVADIHFATTGELQSQTVQRFLLRMMPTNGTDKPNPADLTAIADIKALTAAANAGQGAEALAIYDRLPEKFKKDKAVQVLRVIATAALNDGPKLDAVADDFQKRFGADPACDLVMLDTYIARKDLTAAEACVDRLDKSVGGDAYLDVMRAGFLFNGDKIDRAQASALRAHQRDPLMFEAVDTLMTIAAKQGNHEDTKRWMLVIEREPAWNFRFDDALNNSELFAAFKASPQYEQWLAERPKRL